MSVSDWPDEEWHGYNWGSQFDIEPCSCEGYVCRDCGSEVRTYNANGIIYEERQPGSELADYWVVCMNAQCANHYGVGMGTTEGVCDVAEWAVKAVAS